MPSPPPLTCEIVCNGARLGADPSGALVWRERRLAVVADLHLEKGSSFARRGTPLPPYDTRATLARLEALVERHGIETLVALGDSFHDGDAAARLDPADAARIVALTRRCRVVWIAGNHDPAPPPALGGEIAAEATIGPLVFRHQARSGAAAGELSGHFHPVARVELRAGRISGRCFVGDGERVVLPAFGSFTGGLDVFDPAIAALFPGGFRVHVIGRERVVTVAPDRLAPRRRMLT